MAYLKAKEHLEKYNLENRIIEFPISTATVKEAANALEVSDGEIAKSMAFVVKEEYILVLAAGDKKINNALFKQEFGTKAKMIPFDLLEEVIGHAGGGVCPFGIKEGVKVYLDESLKVYDIVYPACGTANTAVKLSIEELEKASNYLKWVNICN
ncbi:MAG: YbaK/EbsC family protein [Bacilli bacterium]|nr:YbaK/EbsC family protein [Bacilli bacterium]